MKVGDGKETVGTPRPALAALVFRQWLSLEVTRVKEFVARDIVKGIRALRRS